MNDIFKGDIPSATSRRHDFHYREFFQADWHAGQEITIKLTERDHVEETYVTQ